MEEATRNGNGTFSLKDALIVGDSITDFRLAQVVEAAGGLVVAWNANEYLLPYATCGVAALDARAVQPLFEAWQEGGRPAVRDFVESNSGSSPDGPYYHWLAQRSGSCLVEVLEIHQRLRLACRGAETAALV